MAYTYEEKVSALNDLREYLDAAIASGEITEAEARRLYSFEEDGFFLET